MRRWSSTSWKTICSTARPSGWMAPFACLRNKPRNNAPLNRHRLLGPVFDRRRGEPAVPVGGRAIHDAEEFVLQRQGDRSGNAAVDGDLVNGADGGDFGSCAAEENFVRQVKHFARNGLLDDF